MEVQEKYVGSQQKFRSEERIMEIEEEKVRSLSKVRLEGKRVMEMSEKEEVLHHEFKVRSWSKKFISEEKYGLEKEEKEAIPLQNRPWSEELASEKRSCMEA